MKSKKKTKRLLLATGGTGGHLFPAQAIAVEVMSKLPHVEVLFAGAGLKNNRFFDKKQFSYCQIPSTTIFQRNIFNLIKAPFKLLNGILKGLKLICSFKPDLVVGFGSFHSMPILAAAKFKNIPIVLFEANAYPGRVNRVFSRWAKWCAIYFPDAAHALKTHTHLADMPFWRGLLKRAESVTREDSRSYMRLSENKKTLLIFGGSQGAASINAVVCESLAELGVEKEAFQIFHITGSKQAEEEMREVYTRLRIHACVKDFEKHMHLVWPGIDLAICRAGAGSIAEQINYGVPSILIPYPHASGDHQMRNGRFMAHTVRGAHLIPEPSIKSKHVTETLIQLLATESNQLDDMRDSIDKFKKVTKRSSLAQLIVKELQ